MVSFSRTRSDAAVAAVLRPSVIPLTGGDPFAPLLAFIGDAPLVLLGEATHGTQDFYVARAELTRLLIEQRDFSAVAIEGDWPDAYQVNRYVQLRDGADDWDQALSGFERFPTWMWRNTAVAGFVAWLRSFNARRSAPESRVGFYGLDLYSLHASMREVVAYLEARDPTAARAARESYGCFDQFGPESDTYAWASARLDEGTCEEAVTRQLLSLRERRAELLRRDGVVAADDFFYAEQNARLARNAERYYRTMFRGRTASWNVRDEHMAETLDQLLLHLRRRRQPPRVVVWAHNSHLGDARATEMGDDGQLNVGQLVREQHGAAAKLIGFTTHSGTVVAAADWGEPAERQRVRPALPGSYEQLFHQVEVPRFFLALEPNGPVHDALATRRLERAIGVVYRPETERLSHYFDASLAAQFDGVVHLDRTEALDPLDPVEWSERGEVPETFPSGV